jgi:hypothetical protein
MNRRTFGLAATLAIFVGQRWTSMSRSASQATLLSVPIELGGDWDGSPQPSALTVINRMRAVSLGGVPLLSDRQPEVLRVDNHRSGPPFVWLHSDPPREAWIVVDVGGRDWSKLAYQFGHELGHVFCNSWQLSTRSNVPCQWLEESLVEAFSLRGLRLLAESWDQEPPFPGTASFGRAIEDYCGKVSQPYRQPDVLKTAADTASWFFKTRDSLADQTGVGPIEGPAILAILDMLEDNKNCIGDMGALNRWDREALPLESYLSAWIASCAEIGSSGRLPILIKKQFGIG